MTPAVGPIVLILAAVTAVGGGDGGGGVDSFRQSIWIVDVLNIDVICLLLKHKYWLKLYIGWRCFKVDHRV